MGERITHAAIQHDGMTYRCPPPARHNDIIRFLEQNQLPKAALAGTQGYWTSDERFVDRKEALKIAAEAGQMKATPHPGGDLFSEDLW